MSVDPLPVLKASALEAEPPERRWLIRDLWSRAAAGVVGGQPKLGKSWLALDMAVSVASGTPCLDQFEVDEPGPVLVYFAEDGLCIVRSRLEALCKHRGLSLDALDLYVVDIHVLRLDAELDRKRLMTTVDQIRPKLLVLDPLVRMHAGDENSATEIARLLGHLTELQRTFDCAVVLVHHTSKKTRRRPGQALRGSSDLHAWGASNLYITKNKEDLLLTIEHRAAAAPDPLNLELVTDDDRIHLATTEPLDRQELSIEDRLLSALASGPSSRGALRSALRINNQRLGSILVDLQRRGLVRRDSRRWYLCEPERSPAHPAVARQLDLLPL